VASDWRDNRVGSALRGENPLVMARMRSGFAVIGDTQHLPGYSLLLTDDPSANHLTDLDWERGDTRFRAENLRLHRELFAAGVPHLFRLYPGAHAQTVWSAHAAAWLRLALDHLTIVD
jgi:hypothetical protein